MTEITLRILVCGFCAYRLARIVAVDSITSTVRAWIYVRAFAQGYNGEAIVRSKVWAWAYGLASCMFCAGFWLALASYALWVNVPGARPFVAAVSVAGVQAILANGDRAAFS